MSGEYRHSAEQYDQKLVPMLVMAERTGVVSMCTDGRGIVSGIDGTEIEGLAGQAYFGSGAPDRRKAYDISLLTDPNGAGTLPEWAKECPESGGALTAETLAFIPLNSEWHTIANRVERPAFTEQCRVAHPWLGRLGLKKTVLIEHPPVVSSQTCTEIVPRKVFNPYTQGVEGAVAVCYRLTDIMDDLGRRDTDAELGVYVVVPVAIAQDFYRDVSDNLDLARAFADAVLLQQCNYEDLDAARRYQFGRVAERRAGKPITLVRLEGADYAGPYRFTVLSGREVPKGM